jgi:glucan-binding YG repeat protein
MVVGGKKASKGKSVRGSERIFADATELERESRELNNRRRQSTSGEEESEDEAEKKSANPAADFIEISNPNRTNGKNTMKLQDLDLNSEQPELSRREKEALQKEQAKAHYMKMQMEGKTDQARADLARLAIIRKQREDAKLKKEELVKVAETKKKEALSAGRSIIDKSLGKQ